VSNRADCDAVVSEQVRVSCPKCGEVDLRAGDVIVAAHSDATLNTYQFNCSRCGHWTIRTAAPSLLVMLLRSGARVARSQVITLVDDGPDILRGSISDIELIEFLENLDRLPTSRRSSP
jgi:predicted RNA-binding Zn-ribbon protein involved in translation (DUF1610 family)